MIYSYKYLKHAIQGFHENIAFFFEELFRTKQTDVEKLVRANFWKMIAGSNRMLDPMKTIADIYVNQLTTPEQAVVEQAFITNNAIEDVCNCAQQPYHYSDLAVVIQAPLKSFFTSLWNDYPFTVNIETAFGTVKQHFDAFVDRAHQIALICPFCGIHPLKPAEGKHRDAYDHFVPKAKYPFSAVNFHNLVPTCTECNSDEKKAIDVPYRADGRSRPILYPFQTHKALPPIDVLIEPDQAYNAGTLSTSLASISWRVVLVRPGDPAEDFTGWDEVYKVERRYKERIRQFESEWWERFKDYYTDHRDRPFSQIQTEWLHLHRRVVTRQMGILEVGYYRYLFSRPNLEKTLQQTLQ